MMPGWKGTSRKEKLEMQSSVFDSFTPGAGFLKTMMPYIHHSHSQEAKR